MKLNFAHICERAFISESNIPSVIGIFSRLRATSLPASRRNAAIILNFSPGDRNKHSASIELVSPKEKRMADKKIDMEAINSIDGSLGFVANFANLSLEEEGDYTFRVAMDGKPFTELKFNLEVEKN